MDLYKICKLDQREDSFYIFRIMSYPITYLILNSKLKITPNQVTYFHILLTILALYFLTIQGYIYPLIACLILLLAMVFDCVDGNLARNRGYYTKRCLDGNLSIFIRPTIFFIVGIRLFVQTSNFIYIILGYLGVLGIGVGLFFANKSLKASEDISFKLKKKTISKAYIHIAKLLHGQFLYSLLLFTAIFNILWVFLVFFSLLHLARGLEKAYTFIMYQQRF